MLLLVTDTYIYIYIYIKKPLIIVLESARVMSVPLASPALLYWWAVLLGPDQRNRTHEKKSNFIAYSNETWLVFFNTKIKGLYEPPSTVAEILSQISGSLWSHLSGKQNWFFILFVGLVVSGGGGGGNSGCGCIWW